MSLTSLFYKRKNTVGIPSGPMILQLFYVFFNFFIHVNQLGVLLSNVGVLFSALSSVPKRSKEEPTSTPIRIYCTIMK